MTRLAHTSHKKQLWLLVGGNGAGKSTFFRLFLEPLGLPFVNADRIAKDIAPDAPEKASYKAAQMAERLRYDLLRKGVSFCYETVFSHPSKIDFVAHAKALGYEVVMVFIHLQNPSLNKARVNQRTHEGGHDVPEDKIEQRLIRTLHNIKAAIPLCDVVRMLDNSTVENPFRQIALIDQGFVEWLSIPPPIWAAGLCSGLITLDMTAQGDPTRTEKEPTE